MTCSRTRALDESERWRGRPSGMPDILIAAANERNVRAVIEGRFSASPDLRHDRETLAGGGDSPHSAAGPVLRVLVPGNAARSDRVWRGNPRAPKNGGPVIDAALPFLSFAAGVMAAAEILKTWPSRVTPLRQTASS